MKDQTSRNNILSCLYMAVSAGFFLAGYDFIRTPSNTLIKEAYGVDTYTIALVLVPFVVFAFVYLYGLLINRYTSLETLTITSLISALAIGLCYLLIIFGIDIGRIFLFMFREAYIVLLIEQIWSFINNTIDTKAAKKLNGLLLAISSIGSVSAAYTVKSIVISLRCCCKT